MTFIDYVIVGIIAFSAVYGLARGFLREVCSLVTWVLAVWFAWHFGPLVEPYLGGALRDTPVVRAWVARVPVFLFVLMVGTGVGALLGHFVRLSIFRGLDRLLGFLLGFLRGAVVLGIVVLLAQAVELEEEGWWQRSRLLPYVSSVADALRFVAGGVSASPARDTAALPATVL